MPCSLLHRRAGGLEIGKIKLITRPFLHRRAGGLERNLERQQIQQRLHRRAGGLEKKHYPDDPNG